MVMSHLIPCVIGQKIHFHKYIAKEKLYAHFKNELNYRTEFEIIVPSAVKQQTGYSSE